MKVLRIISIVIFVLASLGCKRDPQPSDIASLPTQIQEDQPELLATVADTTVALTKIKTQLEDSTYSRVDILNGVVDVKSGSVIPIDGKSFTIAGFAVDKTHASPAAGVVIVIGEQTFLASYGGERPGIAAALRNPNYLKSQFHAIIPTDALANGVHNVSIRVIASDYSGYFASDWSAVIEIAK